MTDNTLKTNNTQQVEPEFRPLTKQEAERTGRSRNMMITMLITLTKQAVMWDSRQL